MDTIIQAYESGVVKLSKAAEAFPPEQLDYRSSADSWTIREIIVHVADAEIVAVHRMKSVIAEERPLLTAIDEKKWTTRLATQTQDPQLAIQLFAVLRQGMAAVLRELTPADWERTGVHTEAGIQTLQQIVEGYTEHLHVHLRQIERVQHAYHASRKQADT
ncbi:DinB family protein [Paenibacillus sp. 1P07SE]|uniref:DinB family protein n=1 Tax=Paenibacillus sp. 1P07SE TaxID=3132209 RepID=UPI0039A6CAD3